MFLEHFRSNFTVENKVFDFLLCVYVCVIYITDFFPIFLLFLSYPHANHPF